MGKETTLQDLKIEIPKLKEAARVFRAINHDLRLKILRLLHRNVRMNVTSIYQEIGAVQSVTSSHLAILRKARLVTSNRDKREIYYSVNYNRLEEVSGITKKLLSFDDGVAEREYRRLK